MTTPFYTQTATAEDKAQIYLMADQDPADARRLSEMLDAAAAGQFNIVCAESYQDTLQAIRNNTVKALSLDFNGHNPEHLSGLSSFYQHNPDLPVLLLTDAGTQGDGISSLLDKMSVIDDQDLIQQRLRKIIHSTRLHHLQLARSEKIDILTQAANFSYFKEVTRRALAAAERGGLKLAILYFDLDEFKQINTNFGHTIGDQVLTLVARRVRQVLRKEDTFARIKGDEFVVLVERIKDEVHTYPVARHIYSAIKKPMTFQHITLHLSPSIGIASYPESETVAALVTNSHMAMREAKDKKDHFVHFYTRRHKHSLQCKNTIESYFSRGLELADFRVMFQPIVDARSRRAIGVEALLRWQHPQLGEIKPGEFIEVAAWSKAIDVLYAMVLEQTLMLLGQLQAGNSFISRAGINVTTRQLSNSKFISLTLALLQRYQIATQSLTIEISATQAIDNMKQCQHQLQKIRQTGIKVVLQDFGVGGSCLTQLQRLPLDGIKINHSLSHDLRANTKDLALTAGLIEMATRLGLETTAMAVERIDDAEQLSRLQCDYFQGYLYSKPISAQDIMGFKLAS